MDIFGFRRPDYTMRAADLGIFPDGMRETIWEI